MTAQAPGGRMEEITREMIIKRLTDDWGGYITGFGQLTPEGQKKFLQRQGYASLRGLLGHVMAWWELGKYTIEQILIEPDFKSTDVDVDTFNAEAVERFACCSDVEIVDEFEAMRLAMLKFVESLPERAFANKRINERLYVEFIDHYEEHR